MILLYRLFLLLYKLAIQLASLWNSKAKSWVNGRQNWEQSLASKMKTSGPGFVVWMHCASLGEFEQGRPVIEAIRKRYPDVKIMLTFFSPSGYEIRKNYPGADHVMYLPLDSPKNANKFLSLVKPNLAIFVKYEFWHFYLKALHEKQIPVVLISGIFRPSQPFFHWWGGFHRNMLKNFTHLFVQNDLSGHLLQETGLGTKTTVTGDTRFDRVRELLSNWQPIDVVSRFSNGNKMMVAGSTWKEDETILASWFHTSENWQLIIAPHEINTNHIHQLKELFPNAITYSDLSSANQPVDTNVLIIDNIGMLSRLYKYGTVCYVGGGFNKSGHHNILEAAVYNKAVITGPNYQKFLESIELKKEGGCFTVTNETELKQIIKTMDPETAGEIAGNYVQKNSGATEKIMNWFQVNRLFTNE